MEIRNACCFWISVIGLCLSLCFPVQTVYGESAGVATETEAGFTKSGTLPPEISDSSQDSVPTTKKGLLPNTGEMIIAGITSSGIIIFMVILVIYATKRKLERR